MERGRSAGLIAFSSMAPRAGDVIPTRPPPIDDDAIASEDRPVDEGLMRLAALVLTPPIEDDDEAITTLGPPAVVGADDDNNDDDTGGDAGVNGDDTARCNGNGTAPVGGTVAGRDGCDACGCEAVAGVPLALLLVLVVLLTAVAFAAATAATCAVKSDFRNGTADVDVDDGTTVNVLSVTTAGGAPTTTAVTTAGI
jgi:hypothetical protein